MLGFSVPQPPPLPTTPWPKLFWHHQTVILVISANEFLRKNSIPFIPRNLTLPKFLHLFFLRNTQTVTHSLTRSGKVDGMVSNLQRTTVVTITNKTPHYSPRVFVDYDPWSCYQGDFHLEDGDTWTLNNRDGCLVKGISAKLIVSNGQEIECAPVCVCVCGYRTTNSID